MKATPETGQEERARKSFQTVEIMSIGDQGRLLWTIGGFMLCLFQEIEIENDYEYYEYDRGVYIIGQYVDCIWWYISREGELSRCSERESYVEM